MHVVRPIGIFKDFARRDQACLIDHSDISPFRITNLQFRMGRDHRDREMALSYAVATSTSAPGDNPLLNQPRERIKARKSIAASRSDRALRRQVLASERRAIRRTPSAAPGTDVHPSPRAQMRSVRDREPGRSTVDDLCHQRERLQRARPELFQKQKGGKVFDITLVGEREHRAQPSLVHVRCRTSFTVISIFRHATLPLHHASSSFRILANTSLPNSSMLLRPSLFQRLGNAGRRRR